MASEEQKKPSKRDEDPVGKVYDSRLIRRLAHYLKPYWVQAAVSTLCISLKAISDVTGPYLVKVGIDRYLTGKPGPATSWLVRHLPADPYQGIIDRLSVSIHTDLPDAVDRPEDHVRHAARHLPPHAAHAHRLF